MKAIKNRKPVSVYELARMADRDIKNVLQDLTYLQELRLVEITKTRRSPVSYMTGLPLK